MPIRYASIMPRPHPPESPTAPVIPSITATEFATWLLAPHSVGPCPWSVVRAGPKLRHRPHETDAAEADILAIFESIDQ